jgi:ER lumen protein retaining receptor
MVVLMQRRAEGGRAPLLGHRPPGGHDLSVIILLLKIYANKSCSGKHNPSTRIPRVSFSWLIPPPAAHTDLARAGLSRKTQELYLAVFVARYLDLFTDYISVYNTVMKLVFITTSAAIFWYMRQHPQVRQDTFRHAILAAAAFVLALIFNDRFTIREVILSDLHWIGCCII